MFITKHTTLIQSNTKQVYFNSINYPYMSATHCNVTTLTLQCYYKINSIMLKY